MYFGIVTYIETRKWEVFVVLGIFLFSLVLEIGRLNTASYKLDVNDIMRTSRDILWTLIMIRIFQYIRKYFPYQTSSPPKKKLSKKTKK